jgi:hypothetical protein
MPQKLNQNIKNIEILISYLGYDGLAQKNISRHCLFKRRKKWD